MIPLRDSIPSERFPIVNYTIMALCSVAFFLEMQDAARLEILLDRWALHPARLSKMPAGMSLDSVTLYVPLISSVFLHAGFMHFLGNMLFLWIFGDNIEDRMGHLAYLLFYLTGGVVAGLAHVVSDPASTIPTLGASGAIAAVMGAYMLLYPKARIQSVVIVVFFIRVISVPAVLYLLLWFALQLLHGTSQGGPDSSQGGVAWWAHLGGFAFGCLTVVVLGLRSPPARGE